jgi:two-component system, NtrC family, nitrogen regulation sensor histidine kinase NtrY
MLTARANTKRLSWLSKNLALILTLLAFASAVITYMTIADSEVPLSMKPKRVWTLLLVNLGLLILLIVTMGTRIVKLWAALRANSGGSRLQKRILVLFSIVTILPTLIVSVFSALFFNLGIQTWFNERVQTAVQESLMVAEAYLSEHKENIRADALAMAGDLNQVSGLALTNPTEFNRIVATQSALRLLTESIVFRGNRILAQGRLSFALAFEHISQSALERAAAGEVVTMTTDDDKVRALVKLDNPSNTYLLVGRLVDSRVIDHMQSAQGAVNEYSVLKNQLNRLQIVFSMVFITLAILLLLSSIGYGMVFASRLTTPISGLATAAERVRGGDFSARVEDTMGKDEIGMLSRAFNRMTEQLQAQRSELIEANRRLDERRRFSEAVLSGVSAGVIAIDRDKRVTLSNRSSAAILSSVGRSIVTGAAITDILPGIHELLAQVEHLPGETAQGTLTVNENNNTLTLHVRVTVEKLGEEIEGFIVTFDDITLLVAAQRNAAWADVARRVAHEIKNPLTPIQLAAERLKRKYLKFISEDSESFVKYTDTIAKHAGDIGKMVEEFISFARMPTPVFSNEDVATILRKAVFSAQVANPGIDYQLDAPAEALTLECDERQIGQIMTNLLKNAAESIEARLAQNGQEKGRITVGLACDNDGITVTVEDNGTGFPGGESQKMLEPYVTTRSKGMGLGLSIVKKIVEDHKGRINIENISPHGARVMLSFLQQCDINAAS